MPIKYVGRTTDFSGKPLWEILGNLKNCGVGRLVKRQSFERYPEPCFFRILKVETVPIEVRYVHIYVFNLNKNLGTKTISDTNLLKYTNAHSLLMVM